jgi:hypothetical protein
VEYRPSQVGPWSLLSSNNKQKLKNILFLNYELWLDENGQRKPLRRILLNRIHGKQKNIVYEKILFLECWGPTVWYF